MKDSRTDAGRIAPPTKSRGHPIALDVARRMGRGDPEIADQRERMKAPSTGSRPAGATAAPPDPSRPHRPPDRPASRQQLVLAGRQPDRDEMEPLGISWRPILDQKESCRCAPEALVT